MDRTGYDAVWLAEHHFRSFSVCPSVHMVGTLAAARTKRLRIGTAVSLAPFYHPLRLAEEVALLDLLSGGRVNWGAGRGFARVEFTAFGVPPEESASRFRETVEIVLRAWTDERLRFRGPALRFDDVEVLPKPTQPPHPPVWLAAGSEGAIEWAAGRGFSILMDPHSSAAEIGASGDTMPRSWPRRGFRSGSRHPDGAPGRDRRQRGEARGGRPQRRRNGSSIPISARSIEPVMRGQPSHRPGSIRFSAISTRSSCTAPRTRSATRSCGCATRSASTTCCARRSAIRSFMLLTEQVLPRIA